MHFAFSENSQPAHVVVGRQPQGGVRCTHVEQGQHPMWMPHPAAQNVALGWVIQGASTRCVFLVISEPGRIVQTAAKSSTNCENLEATLYGGGSGD